MGRWLIRTDTKLKSPEHPARVSGGRAPRRYLLRHFDRQDLIDVNSGSVNFGAYDGFVYNRQFPDVLADQGALSLMQDGVRGFFYYTVLDFPFQQSVLSGPWFDWLRNQIQFAGPVARILRSRSGQTVVGLFRFFCTAGEYRELIDWSKITATYQDLIVNQMLTSSLTLHPEANVFLDQTWLSVPTFFVCDATLGQTSGFCGSCISGHGAVAGTPPEYLGATVAEIGSNWTTHRANLHSFLSKIQSACEARGGWALKNGENFTDGGLTVPRPVFLEEANEVSPINLRPDYVAIWLQDKRSVLEVKILPHPYPLNPSFHALLDLWVDEGGWVAVNSTDGPLGEPAEGSSGQKMQEAYALLNAARGGQP